MLAYSTEHLDNADIVQYSARWQKDKLITDQNFEAIKTKYPNPLYTPNFFIRIGLFIFTVISVMAGFGLIMLFTGFGSLSDSGYAGHFIVDGIIVMAILEFLIKEKKLYKSGIDDALLYIGISSIISGVCILFYSNGIDEVSLFIRFCFVALIFLVAAGIRYSDMLIAAAGYACLFLLFFLILSKTGDSSKYTMPFMAMLFSTGSYYGIVKLRKKEPLRFWDSSLWVLEILSLVLFCLAGNYYVVRTLSEELFHLNLQEGEDIPLAFVFYVYTALVPLSYIFMGLKNKDKVLLQTGLILIAISVLTFKYYFSLGHHEVSFTLGGIIMIAVAWFSIRYLKTPRFGITYKEDKNENLIENFDAEALVIAQTFSTQENQSGNNTEMGGGKFGGGGADSSF